jgi:hypothetical protein
VEAPLTLSFEGIARDGKHINLKINFNNNIREKN